MNRLILIRHGQTDWNAEGRWQGQADPPLNEHGRIQARQAAEALALFELDALYSSDLRRAWETAECIGLGHGLKPLTDPRLREICLGEWQGLLSTDIQRRYPNQLECWLEAPLACNPPGGESVLDVEMRVCTAVDEILAKHPGKRVAIVSHEFPIALLRCRAAKLSPAHLSEMAPENGSWIEVQLDGPLPVKDSSYL